MVMSPIIGGSGGGRTWARSGAHAPRGAYDPSGYIPIRVAVGRNDNNALYDLPGLQRAYAALKPGGRLCVWSGFVNTVTAELGAADQFSLAQSRVLDLLDLNDVKLYTALLPHENLPVDLIFTQRKILGLVLFLRSLGASLPVMRMLKKYENRG